MWEDFLVTEVRSLKRNCLSGKNIQRNHIMFRKKRAAVDGDERHCHIW